MSSENIIIKPQNKSCASNNHNGTEEQVAEWDISSSDYINNGETSQDSSAIAISECEFNYCSDISHTLLFPL